MTCNIEKKLSNLLKHLSKKLWKRGRNGAWVKVLTLSVRYSTSDVENVALDDYWDFYLYFLELINIEGSKIN